MEILFRGKVKNKTDYYFCEQMQRDSFKNGFAYGSLVTVKDKSYICIGAIVPLNCLINNTYATMVEVIPETVGAYIGLTDTNGKKIFKGDIIRYADIDEYKNYCESLVLPEEYEGVDFSEMWEIDTVVYCDKMNYPAFDLNNNNFECNGIAELISSGEYFYEVIGNIYDNPELLKK